MYFNFSWHLYDNCNYNCSYCIQHKVFIHETKSERYERLLKQAPQIKSLIDNLEPEYDQVDITLIGGEITLLSLNEIKNIISNLITDRIYNISIVSNLSASTEWYIGLADFLSKHNVKLSLTASYHNEMTKIDTFFNKAEIVYNAAKEVNKNNAVVKWNFKVTTVITKDNKNTFGDLFIKNAIERKIPYRFNYNRKERWSRDEKYKNLSGKISKRKWEQVIDTEDIYGYICSGSIHEVRILPDGKMRSTVSSCSNKLCGILGMTKKITHESLICKKHSCSMCSKIVLKRPDGSIFLSNVPGVEM